MNPLILWRLKKFCDEHELDPQEIDTTLTYWEALAHLKSLTPRCSGAEDYDREDMLRWRAEEERYRMEHFLQSYIMAALAGETKAADVGPPIEYATGFSLAAYIRR